jgi:MarR family transcriptional regulator, organic hydroperoxide resistance regulator
MPIEHMPNHSSSPILAARGASPADSRSAILERVATRWLAELRDALLQVELTHAQFRLLSAAAWLTARTDAVRQSDIATHAHMDTVMTSEVLRALEARGLISRTAHPTDRRARAVVVTDTGGKLADRAARLVDVVEERFFATGLADFGQLSKVLKKGGRGESVSNRS